MKERKGTCGYAKQKSRGRIQRCLFSDYKRGKGVHRSCWQYLQSLKRAGNLDYDAVKDVADEELPFKGEFDSDKRNPMHNQSKLVKSTSLKLGTIKN